jgi:hypothetical protein
MLTTIYTLNSSCPDQAVEQRPRQHKSTDPVESAARPKLECIAVVSSGIKRLATFCDRIGGDLEDVVEGGGDEGEDEVNEEAVVGFQAEDACCDAEEGGGEAVNVCKGLRGRRISGQRRACGLDGD